MQARKHLRNRARPYRESLTGVFGCSILLNAALAVMGCGTAPLAGVGGSGRDTLSATITEGDDVLLPAGVVDNSPNPSEDDPVSTAEDYSDFSIGAVQTEGDPNTWQFEVASTRGRLRNEIFFVWELDGQTYNGPNQSHTFSEPGTYVVKVTGSDRKGATLFVLSINITIPVFNQPPIADAGVDESVEEGALATLFAVRSYDPNDTALTYRWTQTTGPPIELLTNDEVSTSFIAPVVDDDTDITVTLTVSDGELTDQDSVRVHVINLVETASTGPTADAGSDQVVAESSVVTLDGSQSGGSGSGALGFEWSQSSGPPVSLSSTTDAVTMFTAPPLADGKTENLVFELVVSEDGLLASDEVTITVNADSGGGGLPVDCASSADCDDGDACNGDEACQSGTCVSGTPVVCDDGLFCNGVEVCVSGSCQAGSPVVCDDGVACTDDACNNATDACDHTPNDAACDNGLFCDGTERCDPVLGCQGGDDPCPAQLCHEDTDTCEDIICAGDAECDDHLFCNGAETCVSNICAPGVSVNCDDGVPCTVDSCNEATDSCDATPNDSLCDNALFCDGMEFCDPVLGCQGGSDPCPGQGCDEAGQTCLPPLLSINPPALAFGSSSTDLTFDVWNSGGGTLDYVVTDNVPWLAVSPASGQSSGEHATITATVDRTGLAQGTYPAEITVTPSIGLAITVAVTALVQPPDNPLTPIARWDVVPYQRIDAGETFKAGVVAFSKNGIQKVTFAIRGQGYTGPATIDVTQMTYNDRTNVWEYWTPIAASSFTSDGPITVEATVRGNDGGIRDKTTNGGGHGLDALSLIVNPTGTVPRPAAWVDASIGNDSTGEVNNEGKPFLTIQLAMTAIRSWRNANGYGDNADGGVVYLNAGTHTAPAAAGGPDVPCDEEWVTVTTAAGATRANTRLAMSNMIYNVGKVRVQGLTLDRSNGVDDNIVQSNSAFSASMHVWIDDCELIGSGRHVENSFVVGMNPQHVFWTNSIIRECDWPTGHSYSTILCRGLTIRDIGNDAFQSVPLVINSTVDNQTPLYTLPKVVAATFEASGHVSGHANVIESPGAFALYGFRTTDYFRLDDANYNPQYPRFRIGGKISNDAIFLTTTPAGYGNGASVNGWLSTGWHSDVWQWAWGSIPRGTEENIIVYGLRATNCGYQGISNNSLHAIAPQARNIAFVNVYLKAFYGGYWQRWTDHLLLWHLTDRSSAFYFIQDVDNYGPKFWSPITHLSIKGCYFTNLLDYYRPSREFGEADFSDTAHNHYATTGPASGWGAINPGTDVTTTEKDGDPRFDAYGRPQTGSPLLSRISPLLVHNDADGRPRGSVAGVGAYEP